MIYYKILQKTINFQFRSFFQGLKKRPLKEFNQIQYQKNLPEKTILC